MTTLTLMSDRGAVGVEPWQASGDTGETGGIRSVQAGLLGTGAVTATIRISGCNDGRFPMSVVDFTLSGTNSATDAAEVSFPWEFFRAEVIAINGTSARASVAMKI